MESEKVFKAPPKRLLLLEDYKDFARCLDLQAQYILRYNKQFSIENLSPCEWGIRKVIVEIDSILYYVNYWLNDEPEIIFCTKINCCNE